MSKPENKLKKLTGYPKQLFLDLISVELNDKQKSILNDDMTFLNFYKTIFSSAEQSSQRAIVLPLR